MHERSEILVDIMMQVQSHGFSFKSRRYQLHRQLTFENAYRYIYIYIYVQILRVRVDVAIYNLIVFIFSYQKMKILNEK